MHVIVGLGNPGRRYENTRHNIGFITVDYLAEKHQIKVQKIKFKALVGDGLISGRRVLLVKPQTYMNLSGESVFQVMDYYNTGIEDLTVIYDDVDIPAGTVRIRKKGSAGSHNGMKSVIYMLGDDGFLRIRIGIGGEWRGSLAGYVTGGFRPEEVEPMEQAVIRAAEAVECMLAKGVDAAMNRYNRRPEKKKKRETDSANESEADHKSEPDPG